MAQNYRLHPWDHTDVTEYTLLSPCIYIVELGETWAPAVIDSAFESFLIRGIQKKMNNTLSYWIGGSTYTGHGTPVTFYEYMPNLSG